MTTTGQLGIAACIVASVTAYMTYVGTTSSWQYYLTVEECRSDLPTLIHQRVRVSGKVAAGSLEMTPADQRAIFKIGEADASLTVRYAGPLPDNFAEGIDVVVEGRLNEAGDLNGEKVLTRCASKYESMGSVAAVTPAQPSGEDRGR